MRIFPYNELFSCCKLFPILWLKCLFRGLKIKWKAPANSSREFYALKLCWKLNHADLKFVKRAIILRREILLYFIATLMNTGRTRIGWFRIGWFGLAAKGVSEVHWQWWWQHSPSLPPPNQQQPVTTLRNHHSWSFVVISLLPSKFAITLWTQWFHTGWPHPAMFRARQRCGWFQQFLQLLPL